MNFEAYVTNEELAKFKESGPYTYKVNIMKLHNIQLHTQAIVTYDKVTITVTL